MKATFNSLVINAGFRAFNATGAHRALRRFTGGVGAILMMHDVRPRSDTIENFTPNAPLVITPAFLEIVIETLRADGFMIVDLDHVLTLATRADAGQRFAVLTFDDGYSNVREHALPVLRKYNAPFTIYVAPGLVEQSVRAWWSDLEHLIREVPRLELRIGDDYIAMSTTTDSEKHRTFWRARNALRKLATSEIMHLIESARVTHGIAACEAHACIGWDDLVELAADPLCTIGAHTMTHPVLAVLSDDDARRELHDSKRVIEHKLGRAVDHLAYPFGDSHAVGQREFRIAAEAGFRSATTTRPGVITRDCLSSPMCLPRVSVNGLWQDRACLEVLLSGVPFAFTRRARQCVESRTARSRADANVGASI